jgi:hypothetical protein
MITVPQVPLARAAIATPAQHPAAPEEAALHEVAAQFEALLFKEAFAPLSKAMGFYGDTVVAAAAQAMMRSVGPGLRDPLEAAMSSAAREAGSR